MIHQFLIQNRRAESIETLEPVIHWHDDTDINLTVVHVATWNRAGLFYKLAGALTLAGVNINSNKVFSRKDHISIDTFYVINPDGGIVSLPKAYKTFKSHCRESLVYGKRLAGEVERLETSLSNRNNQQHAKVLSAPISTKVEVYYDSSLNQNIVEVTTNDRIGLLYQIARQIYADGFDVNFARIATERKIAMDTFYIEKINSLESVNEESLLKLRKKIKAIIDKY